jgi:hypothetical protein
VGRSESAVRKWLRDSRWPFARTAPWPPEQVREMKAWAKMYLSHDPADDYHAALRNLAPGAERPLSRNEQAKLAYMIERAMYVKLRRQREAGELHSVAECQQRRLRQIYEVKSRLLELPRALAGVLAQRAAPEIEAALRQQLLAIIEEFAGETGPQDNS